MDVYFIGSGDLSQSMGYTGQQAHPEVQKVMERGVATITRAGRSAKLRPEIIPNVPVNVNTFSADHAEVPPPAAPPP